MNYDRIIAKRVADAPPSGIRKFFDIASEIKDAISLSVGEPDFVTPWDIRESAIYAIEHGRTHYTSNSGLLELREMICKYYDQRFSVRYDTSQVLLTVGASEAIDLALRAIIEPGDEVLIPAPTYVSYAPSVQIAGGVAIPIPTSAEQEFKLDPEAVERLMTRRTKAIIVPYPNNPTGAVMTRDELEGIARVIEKTEAVVLSDEIYSELTYEGKHASIAGIDSIYERTIVINGFSKAFSMTGWRLGYAMGPKEILSAMLKIHQYTMLCAASISQFAGLEALKGGFEDGFSSVEKMKREYDRRRRYIVGRLNEIGLPCFTPKGAFYAFPSIQSTGMASGEFCEKLLREQKVAVVPGDAFGASGEGYVRISYAASMENIQEALGRIEAFLKEHAR